jgi:hypothetical protein
MPLAPPAFRFVSIVLLLLASGCRQTDDRPYAWGYISPVILQPNCATASCHSRGTAVAGLDFSDPDRGYDSLMGLDAWVAIPQASPDGGCQDVGGTVYCPRARPLVIPYDPEQSRLVNMLRARNAPRMPPDRPLPEADIALIESWILDGARKVGGPVAVDAGHPASDAPAADRPPADAASDAHLDSGASP